MTRNTETAILAGGCSWIMQQLLRHPDGVISTRVGWRVAEETIADVDASGHWLGRTVTEVSEVGRFWEDPAAKQDYFLRFPDYPEGSRLPFPRTGPKAADRAPADLARPE